LSRNAKSRPGAAFGGSCKPFYFIAPDAAVIEAEADMAADEAASIAEEAALIALEAAASVEGVVTTAGAGAGVVVVVVVSSFLLQAANETAAAKVTISNAVFIFLLDLVGSDNHRQLWEPSSSKSPIVFKPWKAGSISSA
jgi:uncharacterized YccA/Bax inhibitor family protein